MVKETRHVDDFVSDERSWQMASDRLMRDALQTSPRHRPDQALVGDCINGAQRHFESVL